MDVRITNLFYSMLFLYCLLTDVRYNFECLVLKCSTNFWEKIKVFKESMYPTLVCVVLSDEKVDESQREKNDTE